MKRARLCVAVFPSENIGCESVYKLSSNDALASKGGTRLFVGYASVSTFWLANHFPATTFALGKHAESSQLGSEFKSESAGINPSQPLLCPSPLHAKIPSLDSLKAWECAFRTIPEIAAVGYYPQGTLYLGQHSVWYIVTFLITKFTRVHYQILRNLMMKNTSCQHCYLILSMLSVRRGLRRVLEVTSC